MHESPIRFVKQRFNLFMIFSVFNYILGISAVVSKEFTEIILFPISNTINEFQPMWVIGISGIVYSLIKNFIIARRTGTNVLSRMFGRSGLELQIMLWGTLASLFFYMGMAFSNSIEFQIGVTIFASIMIYANIKRDKIVDNVLQIWTRYMKF